MIYGQADCLQLLIERKANLFAKTNENGGVVNYLFRLEKTPFDDVCKCIDLLLETKQLNEKEILKRRKERADLLDAKKLKESGNGSERDELAITVAPE